MRDSFIFYRSFYESIKEIPKENQLKVYEALFEYALNQNEVKLLGIEKAIFSLIKPQLDANQNKYENGCKGGRPKTKIKPNNNQNKTKEKPNYNPMKMNNENVNDNVTAIAVKEKSDSCGDGSIQSDSCVDEIVKFFNQNIGMITPHEFEILDSYRSDFSDDIIIYALELQVEKRATGISYAKAILNNWKKKNIKTLLEAQNENNKQKNGNKDGIPNNYKDSTGQFDDLSRFYMN